MEMMGFSLAEKQDDIICFEQIRKSSLEGDTCLEHCAV